jgi:hypothetical protein
MMFWRLFAAGSLIIGASLLTESRARSATQTPAAAQKPKPGVNQKSKAADQEPDPQKERAVQLLREALDSSSTIENVGERSLLVSRAAELIWSQDQPLARFTLSKTFQDLLAQYKDRDIIQSTEKRGRLEVALNRLIATMMRKDPELASSAQQQLNEMRKQQLKGTSADPSNKEKLSLAQDSLGSNLQKSVELAGSVLQMGVPWGFPQFLYDLRQADASSADALYGQGLNILASGRVYRALDAIQLSAYAFREDMMLLPMADPSSGNLQIGMMTKKLTPPPYKLNRTLALGYLAAAQSSLTAQLQLGNGAGTDQVQLVQSVFLATKLSVYSAKLGSNQTEVWNRLKFDLQARCLSAGVDKATIQNVAGFAERLANSDDVFQFGDETSLDNAKDIEDRDRRNEVMVRGIWNLIQGKRFSQAEKRIADVDDQDVRRRLLDLLAYYSGKASAHDRNWSDVNLSASKISDLRIRVLLLLESAKAVGSSNAGDRQVAAQFLLDARGFIPRIEDKTNKIQSLIFTISLAAEVYPQLSAELVPDTIQAMNTSDNYDGGDLQIMIEVVPHFRAVLSSPDSSLEVCLKNQAKVDWPNALRIAEDITSKRLRNVAIVSVCGTLLQADRQSAR